MKKKLIEVALPLEAINKESAREKSIRHGHPSTLHLWWARRPLAACRAVLFAQLVDDPSSRPDKFPTEEAQENERQRLFRIIENLVKWENSNNESVLNEARQEILNSTDGNPPPILDPFCGGGSIPLEAQRLGLKAYASDLNPVAVLITKALIEIPPKFAGQPPVNPESRKKLFNTSKHKGATGLAEDVRYYGKWMRDEAEKRIGHIYPKVLITEEMIQTRSDLKNYEGRELTVIAWLWARTVKCPNPACGATMPLVRSFELSKKKGKKAWVEPIIKDDRSGVKFQVRRGEGKAPEGTVNRSGARCLVCGEPVPFKHVRAEGRAGRMSQQLMAIVCEGERERVYLDPQEHHIKIADLPEPDNAPDTPLPEKALGFRVQQYGLVKHKHLFTNRQLTALCTFSDLVMEARDRILKDAVEAGLSDDQVALRDGGCGVEGYSEGLSIYNAMLVDRLADRSSTICSWDVGYVKVRNTFGRQAIPMTWDFAESNPFSCSTGCFSGAVDWIAKVLDNVPSYGFGKVTRSGKSNSVNSHHSKILLSTDPPYYDNIGYSDLSDFFYIWLRRSIKSAFPNLLGTMLTPKTDELIATPYRFDGNKKQADEFFEAGLRDFFDSAKRQQPQDCPMAVYYAFKQAELDKEGLASTGWETMLAGLIDAGFIITGTWPVRSELANRPVASGTNALASSIVLACRPRKESAGRTTRGAFITELKRELPEAIRTLQKGNIAPVDLAQSSIGPGMAVFSKYSEVLESDGSRMSVRTALALINQVLHEVLTELEGDFDGDTRWALAWFEQNGFDSAPYGEAETLSKAKNTSVDGMVKSGILTSSRGKVRLLRKDELPEGWDPGSDSRITVWEITHYMIRYILDKGVEKAADLRFKVGPMAEAARDLAYRLYQICDEKGWSKEAFDYNTLVSSWGEVTKIASRPVEKVQGDLFGAGE